MGSVVCTQMNKPKIFNVKDYGAVGDGVTMNTIEVQKVIDVCSESGGGTVWVPARHFEALIEYDMKVLREGQ